MPVIAHLCETLRQMAVCLPKGIGRHREINGCGLDPLSPPLKNDSRRLLCPAYQGFDPNRICISGPISHEAKVANDAIYVMNIDPRCPIGSRRDQIAEWSEALCEN